MVVDCWIMGWLWDVDFLFIVDEVGIIHCVFIYIDVINYMVSYKQSTIPTYLHSSRTDPSQLGINQPVVTLQPLQNLACSMQIQRELFVPPFVEYPQLGVAHLVGLPIHNVVDDQILVDLIAISVAVNVSYLYVVWREQVG